MLGCSVGNSKSQLHKAKLRIRQLLAHSTESRTATTKTERSRTQPTRSLFETWDLSIEGVALPTAPGTPQLAGPAI
jgi:hypothetical protein